MPAILLLGLTLLSPVRTTPFTYAISTSQPPQMLQPGVTSTRCPRRLRPSLVATVSRRSPSARPRGAGTRPYAWPFAAG
eukprot:7375847-Prymnesium_polylepis.1